MMIIHKIYTRVKIPLRFFFLLTSMLYGDELIDMLLVLTYYNDLVHSYNYLPEQRESNLRAKYTYTNRYSNRSNYRVFFFPLIILFYFYFYFFALECLIW